MNQTEFDKKTTEILNNIVDVIELQDVDATIDIDFKDNILTLETESGVYVINKQNHTKEIWLSSPISGPYHFVFKNNDWLARGGEEIHLLLTKELGFPINNITY